MAAKYDAESILEMVLEIMTSGGALNAQIAAIEAEKTAQGKGLTPALASVASGAYYEQTWSEKMLNTSPSIFYGIEEVKAVANGGVVAKEYKIFVEIVLVDSGMTNDGAKRINRYARALEELFAANYGPAIAVSTVKIDSLRPIAFKLQLDSSDEIRVGGISLSVTLV